MGRIHISAHMSNHIYTCIYDCYRVNIAKNTHTDWDRVSLQQFLQTGIIHISPGDFSKSVKCNVLWLVMVLWYVLSENLSGAILSPLRNFIYRSKTKWPPGHSVALVEYHNFLIICHRSPFRAQGIHVCSQIKCIFITNFILLRSVCPEGPYPLGQIYPTSVR